MKKVCLLAGSIGIAVLAFAQVPPVRSDVYAWADRPVEKKGTSERRAVLEGRGAVLQNMEIHATTIAPGAAPHAPHHHPEEELIIIREGRLKVTINGETRTLGPGSIALAMPGEEHGFENAGETPATYYVLRYTSKDSGQAQPASRAGSSLMIDWEEVAYKPHDKGGRRDFFDRPTVMTKRFEMHVSTLNPGLKSHDPHRHKAEEIVLLVEGNTEMQIGDTVKKARPGDLIYLGSDTLHAIRNDDTKPCIYFAFQWE
ncbi:MAG: cupin domain-containing protein [Chitinophagaceae bacterium]